MRVLSRIQTAGLSFEEAVSALKNIIEWRGSEYNYKQERELIKNYRKFIISYHNMFELLLKEKLNLANNEIAKFNDWKKACIENKNLSILTKLNKIRNNINHKAYKVSDSDMSRIVKLFYSMKAILLEFKENMGVDDEVWKWVYDVNNSILIYCLFDPIKRKIVSCINSDMSGKGYIYRCNLYFSYISREDINKIVSILCDTDKYNILQDLKITNSGGKVIENIVKELIDFNIIQDWYGRDEYGEMEIIGIKASPLELHINDKSKIIKFLES